MAFYTIALENLEIEIRPATEMEFDITIRDSGIIVSDYTVTFKEPTTQDDMAEHLAAEWEELVGNYTVSNHYEWTVPDVEEELIQQLADAGFEGA